MSNDGAILCAGREGTQPATVTVLLGAGCVEGRGTVVARDGCRNVSQNPVEAVSAAKASTSPIARRRLEDVSGARSGRRSSTACRVSMLSGSYATASACDG
ncbi:MAG: hypothetical protein ACM3ZE_19610 [Myxococcales bacterium]